MSAFDIAVVGGGIMGCGTALRVAEGGMRAIVIEQGDLGQGASGVNAGTLSLQIKRVKLMEYAVRGHREWQRMGEAVGFHKTGGYSLAFTDREAGLLQERMELKRQAGAPIVFRSPAELRRDEPGLSHKVMAASFCSEDGFADSSLTGRYYRTALTQAGVTWRERSPVVAIDRAEGGFVLQAGGEPVFARRLLLACGGWMQGLAAKLDVRLPLRVRVNTVSVTERGPRLIGTVIGHATGLLTMKQKPNGTLLIGGGWQGTGRPEQGPGRVATDSLLTNLQLARHALPALGGWRIVRSWTGYEVNTPDFYPLAGHMPGMDDLFVLGGVRGGYTIGPYISRLMGDYILGREPELPLFDPARNFSEEQS